MKNIEYPAFNFTHIKEVLHENPDECGVKKPNKPIAQWNEVKSLPTLLLQRPRDLKGSSCKLVGVVLTLHRYWLRNFQIADVSQSIRYTSTYHRTKFCGNK